MRRYHVVMYLMIVILLASTRQRLSSQAIPFILPQCASGCYSGECHQHHGTCSCKNEFYGRKCNMNCPDNCNRKLCTVIGKCTHGCQLSWYGYACHLYCHPNCAKSTCEATTGTCTEGCKKSWYGHKCDKKCPQNCNTSLCDFTVGRCTGGCHVSWYGEKCDQKCPSYCRGDHCTYDGACDGCKPGYRGNTCNTSCPYNCIQCRQHDNICIAYEKGRYGAMCDQSCNNYNGNICDMKGKCKYNCKPNYYGVKCDTSCGSGCKLLNHTNVVCSSYDGNCLEGCKDGWFGDRCEEPCSSDCDANICHRRDGSCLSCTTGKHGKTCNQTCSSTCSGSECHVGSSGSVICTHGFEDGWWGFYCQHKCPRNCRICGVTSGLCDKCSLHKYGYNCSQTCSDGCVGQDCDMIGVCRQGCLHGSMGEKCQFSSLWFTSLCVLAVIHIICISVFVWKRRSRSSEPADHDDSPSATDIPYTMNDSRTSGFLESNNSNQLSVNANEELPLLRAETFVNQSAVVTRVSLKHFHGYVRKQIFTGGLIKQFNVKCDQYWRNMGQTHMITPDLVIECLNETFEDHFTTRTFYLAKEGFQSKLIKQFHFTTWPDKDVPENVTSLLHLHTAVTSSTPLRVSPVVVHCSAGVGRTGTYIALDYLIHQARVEGVVDVFECVLILRHQRMNLVQTEEQYLLIHDVLLQAIDSRKSNGDYAVATVKLDLDIQESKV